MKAFYKHDKSGSASHIRHFDHAIGWKKAKVIPDFPADLSCAPLPISPQALNSTFDTGHNNEHNSFLRRLKLPETTALRGVLCNCSG